MSDNNDIDRKLWEAASDGDKALVSQLIEQGAKVDWRDGDYEETALHAAAAKGHNPVVTRLLDAGWSLEARTWLGNTPLSLAAVWGHPETAKCLLLRGANIDTQNNKKNSPLHIASCCDHTSMVKLLLQCGANKKIRGRWGRTASEVRYVNQSYETWAVFKEFIEKGLNTKDELLKQAVSEENYDVAIILMLQGASLEGADTFKQLIQMTKKTRILDVSFIGNQFPWIK